MFSTKIKSPLEQQCIYDEEQKRRRNSRGTRRDTSLNFGFLKESYRDSEYKGR